MNNKLAKAITVITLIATMLLAGCSEKKTITLEQYKSTDSDYNMLMQNIFSEQFVAKFEIDKTVKSIKIGKECYKDGKLTYDEKVVSVKRKEKNTGMLGIMFMDNKEMCVISTDERTVSSLITAPHWMESGAYVSLEDPEEKIEKRKKVYVYAASKGGDSETISPQLDSKDDDLNRHGYACYYYVMFE